MSTNSSGTDIGKQGHFPYGESWYLNNSTTKWEFTTYERDVESGNDYARARYNANRLGRFSSPDPLPGSIADPQSLNRYSYVRSMPTMLTDPTGMSGSGPLGCVSAGNQRDDSPGDDADLPHGSGPYADADPAPPPQSCHSVAGSGGSNCDSFVALCGDSDSGLCQADGGLLGCGLALQLAPADSATVVSCPGFVCLPTPSSTLCNGTICGQIRWNISTGSFEIQQVVTTMQWSTYCENPEDPDPACTPVLLQDNGYRWTSLPTPDFWMTTINAGTWYGYTVSFAIDRYGNKYLSPFGVNIGKSWAKLSYSVTPGWLLGFNGPAPAYYLNQFLTGGGCSIGGGVGTKAAGVGGFYAWSSGGTALMVGLVSAQAGISCGLSAQLP